MVWQKGKKLNSDRYIIENILGEGGMGITYLAKNQRSELRVIKTIKEDILHNTAWNSVSYSRFCSTRTIPKVSTTGRIY